VDLLGLKALQSDQVVNALEHFAAEQLFFDTFLQDHVVKLQLVMLHDHINRVVLQNVGEVEFLVVQSHSHGLTVLLDELVVEPCTHLGVLLGYWFHMLKGLDGEYQHAVWKYSWCSRVRVNVDVGDEFEDDLFELVANGHLDVVDQGATRKDLGKLVLCYHVTVGAQYAEQVKLLDK